MISTQAFNNYMNQNATQPFNTLDTNMLVNKSPTPPVHMAAVVPKYTPLLVTLLILLFIDFAINAFSEFLVFSSIAMLVIYIVQDVCIAFNSLVLLIMLINTYMFQAGLISFMIGKFKSVWILTVIYLGLCVGLQIWLMLNRWDKPIYFLWNPGQIALYVIQRFSSILYYYFYKRTAYRLSDSRFYEDSEWLRKEFERRN